MTDDPSRRDAFETIKLAVRAMLGQRDKLPIDAPVRLLRIIKDGEALNTKDADYRAVVDLIERRERWVRESGQRGVANESGPLCEDVKWVVSDLFLDLTEADCRAALGRLAAGEHRGRERRRRRPVHRGEGAWLGRRGAPSSTQRHLTSGGAEDSQEEHEQFRGVGTLSTGTPSDSASVRPPSCGP